MPISAAAGSAITVNPSVVNADGSNTLKSRLKGKSEAAKKVPSLSVRYTFVQITVLGVAHLIVKSGSQRILQ